MGLVYYIHNVENFFEEKIFSLDEEKRVKIKKRKIRRFIDFFRERKYEAKLVTITFKNLESWKKFFFKGGIRYYIDFFKKKNKGIVGYIWVLEWHKHLKNPHYHVIFFVRKGKRIKFWDQLFSYGYSNLKVINNNGGLYYVMKYITKEKENRNRKERLLKEIFREDIEEYKKIRKKVLKMRIFGYSVIFEGKRIILDINSYVSYLRRVFGLKYYSVRRTVLNEIVCEGIVFNGVKVEKEDDLKILIGIFLEFLEELESKIENYIIVGEGFKH